MQRSWRRWSRRLLSVSVYTTLLALALSTAPLWLPLGLLIDLVRRTRFALVRVALFGVTYLAMEQLGVWAAVGLWLLHGGPFARPTPTWIARHMALQRWWSGTLYRAATGLLRMTVEVEGERDAEPGRGPQLVLVRHAGFVDVLLPSAVIANRHGIHLKFVFDRDLLWDPCMDIVGHRLGNLFVQRSSGRPEAQAERIGAMLASLGDREGIALFPEGARYSRVLRERVLASLERRGEHELLAFARSLHHTLPPVPGGVLALLDRNDQADVLIFAHAGLDRYERVARLLDGSAIGTTVRVKLWRISRGDIPVGTAARTAWLLDWWKRVDDWIGSAEAPADGGV